MAFVSVDSNSKGECDGAVASIGGQEHGTALLLKELLTQMSAEPKQSLLEQVKAACSRIREQSQQKSP